MGDAALDFVEAHLSIALLSSTTRCSHPEHPFGLSGMIFANYADESRHVSIQPVANRNVISERSLLTRIFIVGLLALI
jgi:hypothetical protein